MMDYRRKCQVCSGAVAEAVCFFCRARTCLPCLRPKQGMPPICMVCAGEMGSSQPRSADRAQQVEYVVEQMTASISRLMNQMNDHAKILQQLLGNTQEVTTTERELATTEEEEATSPPESTPMVDLRPADQPPAGDSVEARQEKEFQ